MHNPTFVKQVVMHWACAKISASLQQPDDQFKEVLVCAVMQQQGHVLFSIS